MPLYFANLSTQFLNGLGGHGPDYSSVYFVPLRLILPRNAS